MARRTLLGMLTPSSNTVLEPYTQAILAGLMPGVTAHFQRFRVTRIALGGISDAQFGTAAMVAAAELLADARVDVIAWSGTSASWLGFEADERLCRGIAAATGVPATSATLALNEALRRLGTRRLGLVTPYTGDVQDRIMQTYAAAGIEVAAEDHLGEADNFAFSGFDEATIERQVRAVAASRPGAIAILCTNLRGTALAPRLEAELGIPILDSVAVTVWHALLLAGTGPAQVRGWGSVFGL